jgi:hypothetical protein
VAPSVVPSERPSVLPTFSLRPSLSFHPTSSPSKASTESDSQLSLSLSFDIAVSLSAVVFVIFGISGADVRAS